jgi:hypothetical protein
MIIINDRVVQNNASTHYQSKSVLKVRVCGMANILNLFFNNTKHTQHFSTVMLVSLRIGASSLVEEARRS